MSATLPEILVVDVEATCWQGAPPPGQESEIIEFGACLLHPVTGERSGRQSILVRPRRSSVSPFCTELTTLTQVQVAQGIEFHTACQVLTEQFQSRSRVWASYGAYDRKQFARQCEASGVPYPFTETHINVKASLARVGVFSRPVGMDGALKHLGIRLEGTHHRGADDAWNIASILSHLLLARDIPVVELVQS